MTEGCGEGTTKTCPRCGAKLFADMDVCYGCLYDFNRDSGPDAPSLSCEGDGTGHRGAKGVRGAAASAPRHDGGRGAGTCAQASGNVGPARDVGTPSRVGPCWAAGSEDEEIWGSLDELWDDEPASAPWPSSPQDMPPALAPDAQEASQTLRLGEPRRAPRWVSVAMRGATVRLAVPESGLVIGRGRDNDVSIAARPISRHHLRLVVQGAAVVAQDLGATNPALVNGRALMGSASLGVGDVVELRGADVTVRLCEGLS